MKYKSENYLSIMKGDLQEILIRYQKDKIFSDELYLSFRKIAAAVLMRYRPFYLTESWDDLVSDMVVKFHSELEKYNALRSDGFSYFFTIGKNHIFRQTLLCHREYKNKREYDDRLQFLIGSIYGSAYDQDFVNFALSWWQDNIPIYIESPIQQKIARKIISILNQPQGCYSSYSEILEHLRVCGGSSWAAVSKQTVHTVFVKMRKMNEEIWKVWCEK